MYCYDARNGYFYYYPPQTFTPYPFPSFSPVNNQPSYFYHPIPYNRSFPEVNPNTFMTSAKYMQSLMKDASVLLEKMADSKEFAKQLMSAAQESKQNLIEDQIKHTGIQNIPIVTYTPDGLKLQFSKEVDQINCCNLTLALRWM